ncbi:MAG TPA: hypothetical protein VJC13_00885 [Candidatus Paceibacterota bacterium]|nr:hypothetical protein [uncultured archaeon]
MNLRLSRLQLEKISDITISMGQIFFASVLVDPLVSGKSSFVGVFGGLVMALLSWIISVLVIKK